MVQYALILGLIFTLSYPLRASDFNVFLEGLKKNFLPRYLPLAHLETSGFIRFYGKQPQIHFVETKDGYILEMHRIMPSIPQPDKYPPILLVHALQLSSTAWLISPNNSIGSLLANAGYDVWLANLRGTTYSQKHKTLSADDKRFWDFSWDEHGKLDLPAIIDRILDVTGQSQVIVIGHSLGTTSSFVMLSNLTEYQQKVKGLICFGAITDLEAIREPFDVAGMKLITNYKEIVEYILDTFKIYKIYPFPTAGWKYCDYVPVLCYLTYSFLFEGISSEVNLDLIVIVESYFPDYSSYKTFLHYAQVHDKKKFLAFDFGDPSINIQHYGTPTPTFYDLRSIPIPVAIFWGNKDLTSTPESAQTTKSLLPNVQLFQEVPFAHVDYVLGKDIYSLLYPQVESLIEKWAKKQ